MFITISELERRQVRFETIFEPGLIEFHDDRLWQLSPLETRGSAQLLNAEEGELRIRGSLSVAMGAECDRCLEEARIEVAADFDLVYMPVSEAPSAAEVEVEKEGLEVGFYEGPGLDLKEVLREQILLAIPMQRVCREACKGICPACGQDRNQAACNCELKAADDRWAALKDLK
jgi:uncharacterized protein